MPPGRCTAIPAIEIASLEAVEVNEEAARLDTVDCTAAGASGTCSWAAAMPHPPTLRGSFRAATRVAMPSGVGWAKMEAIGIFNEAASRIALIEVQPFSKRFSPRCKRKPKAICTASRTASRRDSAPARSTRLPGPSDLGAATPVDDDVWRTVRSCAMEDFNAFRSCLPVMVFGTASIRTTVGRVDASNVRPTNTRTASTSAVTTSAHITSS